MLFPSGGVEALRTVNMGLHSPPVNALEPLLLPWTIDMLTGYTVSMARLDTVYQGQKLTATQGKNSLESSEIACEIKNEGTKHAR